MTYPTGAFTNDQISFRVNTIDRCNMYYLIGPSFSTATAVASGGITKG